MNDYSRKDERRDQFLRKKKFKDVTSSYKLKKFKKAELKNKRQGKEN